MGTRLNLIGKKFGRLEVISSAGSKNQQSTWLCKCSCGKEKICIGTEINTGHVTSCGCYGGAINGTHNKSRTKTYKVWTGMKGRCGNKNNTNYHDYGGRGIKVCEKWLNSFEDFLKDMGERPKGLSLERINVNENYSKENCKWANSVEQAINKRLNKRKLSKFRGVTLTKYGKYRAFFRSKHLGMFDLEVDAAEKALEYYYNFYGKFPPEFKPIIIPENLKCI